jgi:hypothetical protein
MTELKFLLLMNLMLKSTSTGYLILIIIHTCTIIIKNVRHTNLFVREGFYLIEFNWLVFNANSSSIGFYLHDLLGIQIILNNS